MEDNSNNLPPLPAINTISSPASPILKKKKKKSDKSPTSRSSSPLSATTTSKPPTPKIKRVKLKGDNGEPYILSKRDRKATIDNGGTESDTPLIESAGSLGSIIEPLSTLKSSSLSLSPSSASKKKKLVSVTSPITGEKIVIPSEDIKDPRKPGKLKSKKKLLEDALPSSLQLSSLENLTLPPKDELYIPPIDRNMPDIVFAADDGKTYNPIEHHEYERQLIEKSMVTDQEPILESFTERFLRRRRSIFDFFMAIHSGLCLSTLLILPTQSYSQTPIIPRANCTVYPFADSDILNYGTYPLPELRCKVYGASGINYTAPVGSNNDGGDLVAFLMYYSGKALLLNIIFQIVSSLVLIGSWERLVHVMESKRLTGGDRFIQRAFAWTVTIAAVITYASNTLMSYVDVNLNYSQAGHPSYAKYGEKYWMFDGNSLNAIHVNQDISEWITCNAFRGIFGLIQFLVWMLMKIPSKDRGSVSIKHSSSTATMRVQPIP